MPSLHDITPISSSHGRFPISRPNRCSFSSLSNSEPEKNDIPLNTGNKIVDAMNTALNKHPGITGTIWLYHSPIATGIVYGVLTLFGVNPPPELGGAFVIHGALKRFRMPFSMALAGAVAKVKPEYTKVPVTTMLIAPLRAINSVRTPDLPAEKGSVHEYWEKAKAYGVKGVLKIDKLLGGSDFLNKYGLAYVISGRIVGTISILSLTTALHYGIDVQQYLSSFASLLDDSGFSGIKHVIGIGKSDDMSDDSDASMEGMIATAANWMSRWTLGVLIVNANYLLVLRHGVAGSALRIGNAIDASPLARRIQVAIHEGKTEAYKRKLAKYERDKKKREGSDDKSG